MGKFRGRLGDMAPEGKRARDGEALKGHVLHVPETAAAAEPCEPTHSSQGDSSMFESSKPQPDTPSGDTAGPLASEVGEGAAGAAEAELESDVSVTCQRQASLARTRESTSEIPDIEPLQSEPRSRGEAQATLKIQKRTLEVPEIPTVNMRNTKTNSSRPADVDGNQHGAAVAAAGKRAYRSGHQRGRHQTIDPHETMTPSGHVAAAFSCLDLRGAGYSEVTPGYARAAIQASAAMTTEQWRRHRKHGLEQVERDRAAMPEVDGINGNLLVDLAERLGAPVDKDPNCQPLRGP